MNRIDKTIKEEIVSVGLPKISLEICDKIGNLIYAQVQGLQDTTTPLSFEIIGWYAA